MFEPASLFLKLRLLQSHRENASILLNPTIIGLSRAQTEHSVLQSCTEYILSYLLVSRNSAVYRTSDLKQNFI